MIKLCIGFLALVSLVSGIVELILIGLESEWDIALTRAVAFAALYLALDAQVKKDER